MELTHATVDDLLAQLGPADGYIYLPSDLDSQALTDLLAHRYGTPRTLVLDGFTDPTVDDSSGAALLVPFEDRAVKVRAWAHGDQWVGTGTARDADGVERPVLVVARGEMREPLAVAPDEDEYIDWMERLIRITGWTQPAQPPNADWTEAESRLGTALPSRDVRRGRLRWIPAPEPGAVDGSYGRRAAHLGEHGARGPLLPEGRRRRPRWLAHRGPVLRQHEPSLRPPGRGVCLPSPYRPAPPVQRWPAISTPTGS